MARWTWLIALALLLVPASANAAPAPRIALYTMGPGDDAFSLFGHAALCVFDQTSPKGRCYNYGTTDFSRAAALSYEFLRGEALFWVSVSPEASMVDAYRRRDRAVYRQFLPLTDEQARAFSAALQRDLDPDRSSYRYHHFDDNCATRLRDHINTFSGGKLRSDAVLRGSMRDIVREGLAPSAPLLITSELVLGRRVDRPPTLWQAMFLPKILREQVRDKFGVEPQTVVAKKGAPPRGNPNRGRFLIAWVGSLVGLGLGLLFSSRNRWLRRMAVMLAGAVFGGLGFALAAVACVSALPGLRNNEVLLVLTPLDLMMLFLRRRWLTWFVRIRLAGLAAVLAVMAVGVFVQPLGPPMIAVASWLGCAALILHRRPCAR